MRYLEGFRTSAVKLFISCYLYYVLTGRPPSAVTTEAVRPHLSERSQRPQGLPLGVTTERCGFRQGSMFSVLKVLPSLGRPSKRKTPGFSRTGLCSVICKRAGSTEKSLKIPLGSWIFFFFFFRRLGSVSSCPLTSGRDLGLISVPGASSCQHLFDPPHLA